MILDQIQWVDIAVFLVFLAPCLLIDVGVIELLKCASKALPFLMFVMPFQLIHERYFTPVPKQSPFVQQASLFQDVVIRCVRYAFADIPASIGRVFFSKPVALPFMRFRMLRNGFLRSPVKWREIDDGDKRGVLAMLDDTQEPDIIIYYCHGGGFSMGSSFFYLEFLFAWLDLLKESGYNNPAVFALEYTLVPEATYPTQLQQALVGYKHCLKLVDDPSRVVVSGDSAGATLILSLLLCLSDYSGLKKKLPGLAVIISPWVTIISDKNQNTPSDYLNKDSLHLYGSQYIGENGSADDALVSPGRCKDLSWWKRASPSSGWFVIYGKEEVFAPETKNLLTVLRKTGKEVSEHEEEGWIHAWPVVKLFLSNTQEERLGGLKSIVKTIADRVPPRKMI